MKRAPAILSVLFLAISALALAGDIQVTCEPGLRVFLDGELVGKATPQEDGLFLMNVPDGQHTIRVEKYGFLPQTFEVEVSKLPIQVKVGEFSPEPAAQRRIEAAKAIVVSQTVGELTVTSAPQNCVVAIDGQTRDKDVPYLDIGGLTAGEHTISFSRQGYEPISATFRMQPGAEITARGDLINGQVEFIHEGKGSLRVISKPQNCTVRLLGMVRDKIHSRLNISYLPAGEHHVVFTWRGLDIATDILITNGHRTTVEVSFMQGDPPVIITHAPE